jgi:hypothetical protein
MKIPSVARYALGVVAASSFLAACSAGGSQTGLAGAPGSGASSMGNHHVTAAVAFKQTNAMGYVPVHQNGGKTWASPMKGKGKKTAYLYVSDGDTGTVYVYDWATQKEVGSQTGFEYPYGQCSDKMGDAFVTDFDAGTVTEFKYGQTTGTAVVTGLSAYPIGCAVNPKTGDLAVTQFYGGYYGSGSVIVYKGGPGGKSTSYNFFDFTWPAGYDGKGNLYAEGEDGTCTSSVCIAELPANGSSFANVTYNWTIDFPAATELDVKLPAFGNQETNGEYQSSIQVANCTSSACTAKGKPAVLTDTCYNNYTDVVQWAEISKKPNLQSKGKFKEVAGGNLWCEGVFDIWKFPAGGNPTGTISGTERALGQTLVN